MLARDEEEGLGFEHDDDRVDLALGEDSDSDGDRSRRWKKKTNRRSYHDEFTDNDSDEYVGDASETYGLHSHVGRQA